MRQSFAVADTGYGIRQRHSFHYADANEAEIAIN
jgi:hypothetical protein